MSLKDVERVKERDKARWLMEFPEWVVAAVGSKRDGCGSPGHEEEVVRALLTEGLVMHLMHLHLARLSGPSFRALVHLWLGVQPIFCTVQTLLTSCH